MIDAQTKEIIRILMDDPTAEVELFSGMKETTGKGDENRSFEPTKARTVVIKTCGGANNVQIRHVETEDDARRGGS